MAGSYGTDNTISKALEHFRKVGYSTFQELGESLFKIYLDKAAGTMKGTSRSLSAPLIFLILLKRPGAPFFHMGIKLSNFCLWSIKSSAD